jgi:FKBP-type peptidyl-prolyl cis-trans isomerase
MRTTLAVTAAVLLAACSKSGPVAGPRPVSEDDKTIYALGVALAKNVEVFKLTPAELELVVSGLRDGAAGKPEVAYESRVQQVQALVMQRRQAASAGLAAKGGEYLEKAAASPGAVKTASGLVYVPIQEGTGASPTAASTVKVNYKGQLIDGKVFDASERHGGPATFPLSGVIPCWTEGVQKLKVGGKGRFVCPPNIAYGPGGMGSDIPPNSTLDFEVELLEIVQPK